MKTKFIKTPKDLETTHKATVEGFLEQAITKTAKASPYVKRGFEFYNALQECTGLEDVLNLHDFKDELFAASGFSDKSKSKFSAAELNKSLEEVLKSIFEGSNAHFREEIVFRFLLTKGDSLGGSMRNLTGSLASEKIINVLDSKLKAQKKKPVTETSRSGRVQSIKWNNRILFFDVTPRFIKKNIDMILLKFRDDVSDEKELLHDPSSYLACGELKGGIDPAGADEHWKTANSALERIRRAFSGKKTKPALFFVGAAIETAMSKEIFNQLKTDKLTYVANLTKKKQVNSLVDWLVNL